VKKLLSILLSCVTLVSCSIIFPAKEINYSLNLRGLRLSSGYYSNISSTGEQNILVIPVKFKNTNYGSIRNLTYEQMKTDISNTFFGEPQSTAWESVSSFYKKSSYNKLNIKGKVTDWFEVDKTPAELAKLTAYSDPSYYVVRSAIEWYKANNSDFSTFDKDSDGFFDAVWFVYDYKYDYQSDLWWAFTFSDFQNDPNLALKMSPIAYTYAWASVDFMYQAYPYSLDAHTYIHETGHILGLEDYYPDRSFDTDLVGAIDMMDANIVDHNAYSKYLLDWVTPTVITFEKDITLQPFESSGEFILLPTSKYNDSPLDEYLIIEYYTPTGLNRLDATSPYPDNGVQAFSQAGIKIYHVDSRLGYYSQKEGNFMEFTNEPKITKTLYTDLAFSNQKSRSSNQNYVLLQLLSSTGYSHFSNNKAVDNDLYHAGDVFNPNIRNVGQFHNKGRFNKGEFIPYQITINKLNSKSAEISIIIL
jgi:M6 family metalloprotease-like protein